MTKIFFCYILFLEGNAGDCINKIHIRRPRTCSSVFFVSRETFLAGEGCWTFLGTRLFFFLPALFFRFERHYFWLIFRLSDFPQNQQVFHNLWESPIRPRSFGNRVFHVKHSWFFRGGIGRRIGCRCERDGVMFHVKQSQSFEQIQQVFHKRKTNKRL